MTDRFEVDIGDKGLMIYDNDGVDDYYFVNDKKELQKFCDLINSQPDVVDELKKELINHKNITKSLSQEILELSESFNQVKEENQQLKEALQSAMTKLFGIQSFKIQDNLEYNPLNEFMKEQIDIRSIEIEVDTEKGEIKKCYKL